MALEGFEVEHFEHVAVSAGTVLLRLSGRWFATDAEPLPPPVLVADDGERRHRLELLPGPEDAAPQAGPRPAVWRAAFRAPAALVERPAAFSLRLGPGLQLDLPAPSARAGGRPATVAGRLGAPAERGPREPDDRLERERELRRAAEQAAVDDVLAAQAAAEAERRTLVGQAREDVDRAREDAAAARQEAAQAARSARAARDEAQAAARRLAAAEAAAGALARRADAVEAALGAREDDLRTALGEVAELRAALADREREVAAADAEAADLRDVLAARDRVGQAAGAEIAALAARVDELEPLAARAEELVVREAELADELAAAHLALDAQPQPALPAGAGADPAAVASLEAALAAEREEHRAAAEHAARTERELGDALARLRDLRGQLGGRGRRRSPRADETRPTAGAPAAHVVLRSDRRPAVRTPIAVGVLVVLVVGSGLLLLALLLKVAVAP